MYEYFYLVAQCIFVSTINYGLSSIDISFSLGSRLNKAHVSLWVL